MKNLPVLFFALLVIGCNSSQKDDTSVNTLNENLYSFSAEWADTEQIDEFENKLAWPNDNSGTLPQHSEISIKEYKDSAVVSFWKNEVLYCQIQGDIKITDNQVSLLVGNYCAPN